MSDWQSIVQCPTNGTEHSMKMEDGSIFVGRFSTSQGCWQRRLGPHLYTDVEGNVIEQFIWSPLNSGVYPTHFLRGVEICEWTPRAEDIWDTECRKFFTFSDGTLAENGFEFCPFCGGAIIIQNEGDS